MRIARRKLMILTIRNRRVRTVNWAVIRAILTWTFKNVKNNQGQDEYNTMRKIWHLIERSQPLICACFIFRTSHNLWIDKLPGEMTHKRRISALDRRLSRERSDGSGGRTLIIGCGLCPIENSKGPNIGLISSLCIHSSEWSQVYRDSYRKVVDGKVVDEIEYLSAEKRRFLQKQAGNEPVDSKEILKNRENQGEDTRWFLRYEAEEIDYMDVANKINYKQQRR